MATLTHVRSGDVITSQFFNDLIDTITDLETRLSAVESGSAIVTASIIDHFDPATQIAVGEILTIFGTFDFPLNLNDLTIDGRTINSGDFRPGSNNLKLIVIVPPAIAPPVSGKNITIKVVNTRGTDQKSYRVLPAVPSTTPAPTITTIVNNADNNPTLIVGQKCKITGSGFAATPADNNIVFKTTAGMTTHTIPATNIDVPNTNTTQIVVTVPALNDIPPLTSGPAIVEVSIGSSLPAAKDVTVFRP